MVEDRVDQLVESWAAVGLAGVGVAGSEVDWRLHQNPQSSTLLC